MKKISVAILALSFLVITGECSARTTTVIEERNGLVYVPNETTPFTGTLENKFPNGQKKQEGNFKDGKLDGLRTDWFNNGQKQSELNFKDGKQNGFATFWFENGQVKRKTVFKDGQPIN